MKPSKQPRWTGRGIALLVLATGLLLGGCASIGEDLRRPLRVQRVPADAAELAAMAELHAVELTKDLERSYRYARGQNRYLTIAHAERIFPSVDYTELFKALSAYPQNPYAWVQLGTILAVDRRMDLAIEATGRGLAVIDERRDTAEVPRMWQDVYAVGRLNTAMYALLAGRPADALEAIDDPLPVGMEPYQQVQKHWLRTEAWLELDALTDARDELALARAAAGQVVQTGPGMFPSDYPQLFETECREGVFLLLEGRLEAKQAHWDEAQRKLQQAVKQLGGHEKLLAFEAVFQLARVHRERGDSAAALEAYRGLLAQKRKVERSFVSPEAIYYNVGNIHYDRGDYSTAIEQYTSAEKSVRDQHKQVSKAVTKYQMLYQLRRPEDEAFRQRILSPESGVLSRIFHNRGLARLKLAQQDPKSAAGVVQLRAAIEDLERAVQDEDPARSNLSRINLAEARLLAGDKPGFLSEMQQVLAGGYAKTNAVSLLIESAAAQRNGDPEFAASTYALALGAVSRDRVAAITPDSIAIAREFLAANQQLEAARFAYFQVEVLAAERTVEPQWLLAAEEDLESWELVELASAKKRSEAEQADQLAARGLRLLNPQQFRMSAPWLAHVYRQGLEVRADIARQRGDAGAVREYRQAAETLELHGRDDRTPAPAADRQNRR